MVKSDRTVKVSWWERRHCYQICITSADWHQLFISACYHPTVAKHAAHVPRLAMVRSGGFAKFMKVD